jgi:hypothetical protein
VKAFFLHTAVGCPAGEFSVIKDLDWRTKGQKDERNWLIE